MSPEKPAEADWLRQQERSNLAILKLMVWISLTFGRAIGRVVLVGIAAYFVLFSPKARRFSRAYLQRALDRWAEWSDGYRHVFSFASTIHDRDPDSRSPIRPTTAGKTHEPRMAHSTAGAAASGESALALTASSIHDGLAEVSQRIDGTTVSFVAGTRSHTQAPALRDLWQPLAEELADLESTGQDVIVDAGRLGLVGSPEPLLTNADLTLLVTRTTLPALRRHRPGGDDRPAHPRTDHVLLPRLSGRPRPHR